MQASRKLTQLEVLRACMDQACRNMYDLRVLEYDWRFIAKSMGYKDAHTAEVQFRKKLNRAFDRFRANHHHNSPGIVPNQRS